MGAADLSDEAFGWIRRSSSSLDRFDAQGFGMDPFIGSLYFP
jgi:hypothetical protein